MYRQFSAPPLDDTVASDPTPSLNTGDDEQSSNSFFVVLCLFVFLVALGVTSVALYDSVFSNKVPTTAHFLTFGMDLALGYLLCKAVRRPREPPMPTRTDDPGNR
jgi:hypothetical protein